MQIGKVFLSNLIVLEMHGKQHAIDHWHYEPNETNRLVAFSTSDAIYRQKVPHQKCQEHKS